MSHFAPPRKRKTHSHHGRHSGGGTFGAVMIMILMAIVISVGLHGLRTEHGEMTHFHSMKL